MKKFLYLAILTILPMAAFSQDNYGKYLEGAVPLVDGKVVFNREVAARTLTAEQIFNTLSQWGTLEYSGEDGQMISNDPAIKRITVRGIEQAQVRVGLFPSKIDINYFLLIDCLDGGCNLSFVRFIYTNNPASKDPNEQIKAEEYITDRYALNKAGTKLAGGTGDYRKRTIDLVDNVTGTIEETLAKYMADLENNKIDTGAPANQQTATTAQPAQHRIAKIRPIDKTQLTGFIKAPETEPLKVEDFANIIPEKIPGNIIKIVEDNGIFLTAVNGAGLDREIAGEGGLGVYDGAPSLFFSMKEKGIELPAETQSITFTFKNEVFKNAAVRMEEWMIIVCIPVVAGDNLIIGEIDQVLIK